MKLKYGTVTIGFSGWAQSKRFSFGRKTDYSITMSDHCDFNELVDVVIRSGTHVKIQLIGRVRIVNHQFVQLLEHVQKIYMGVFLNE